MCGWLGDVAPCSHKFGWRWWLVVDERNVVRGGDGPVVLLTGLMVPVMMMVIGKSLKWGALSCVS